MNIPQLVPAFQTQGSKNKMMLQIVETVCAPLSHQFTPTHPTYATILQ